MKELTMLQTSFCKSLFGFCFKKDKRLKLMNQAVSRYENSLDIQSFVSVNTNLNLLMSILLSEKQAFLFKNHKARSLSLPRVSNSARQMIADDDDDVDPTTTSME